MPPHVDCPTRSDPLMAVSGAAREIHVPVPVAEDDRVLLTNFPALASLKLDAGDLRALAEQGFLCAEKRRGKTYHKLRFRRGGRQHVKYVSDREAKVVSAELSTLQAAIRSNRTLARAVREARDTLRQTMRLLQPLMAKEGFVFHGLAIRRRRNASTSFSV